VRVELEVDDAEVWVQVTRESLDRLGLHAGSTVYLRAQPEPASEMRLMDPLSDAGSGGATARAGTDGRAELDAPVP
jgi:hypothetical protein